MIGRILPSPVVSAHALADDPGPLAFEEEARALEAAGSNAARRGEFLTVRHCARRALGLLGHAPAPLLPDAVGAPRWPDGVVGSMTHCHGYRAAAVARSGDVAALGIDAESDRAMRPDTLRAIARPEELEQLADLARAHPGRRWDLVLFSAKEALYKAWFPLTRGWLGFQDATVTIDAARGTFDARVLAAGHPGGPRHFPGGWLAEDGLVVTACVLPRR
ncbi:4'-phosphopantetheinyl transferase family protein [Streptomyces sp. GSL17-111]|uniref:4'-phosphopantetheinyl transferase family protein n=1 Tax=Streptomyces sp. GSL17-111 TaxID=3121596 RepID=UPI0030F41A23